MKTDVLIVGGGLVGCATAYFLARAGVDVLLVERDDLNMRASGANAGSIHVQIPHAEFLGLGEEWARAFAPTLPMMLRSVELWTEIGADLGTDLEVALTGGVIVARTPEQLRAVERKAAIETAHGVDIRMIGSDELRALAPYVSDSMIGGAYCPTEGKANPLIATVAFASAAARHGATIRTHSEVRALEQAPGAYTVHLRDGRVTAGRLVNAAGADAGRIAAMLGVSLPIGGFPLQVSATEPVGPLVHHLVYSAAGKLTLKQMKNGTCLIGGGWPSRLLADGSLAVNEASLKANMGTAIEAVPGLAGARIVRTWPAIVNGTDDWRPLIGEVPGHAGFYLSLFPWMGFSAGPITALVTAELILGRTPSVDIDRISALT
ncbi:MAG: NAD(P)/FAD-dependent oxidoreductase [Inquilinaceae bacterium]